MCQPPGGNDDLVLGTKQFSIVLCLHSLLLLWLLGDVWCAAAVHITDEETEAQR